jgi:hypothetical protein
MRKTRFDTIEQELAWYKRHLSGFADDFEEAIRQHIEDELKDFCYSLADDVNGHSYFEDILTDWNNRRRDHVKKLDVKPFDLA